MSVLVTGAAGYIAERIVADLLDQGYDVIGTSRSQVKADKLTSQFNNPKLKVEVVPDFTSLTAFDDLFTKYPNDIKYVLHTASPITFTSEDYENEILIPAVNGVKGILNSIKAYTKGSVKRFVLTSSVAAMFDLSKATDTKYIMNEDSWDPLTWEDAATSTFFAYCVSKKYAEKAAWDFIEDNKGELSFDLCAINPAFVFGPAVFAENIPLHLHSSSGVIYKLVHSEKDTYEIDNTFHMQSVDVRDVAKAHIIAMTNPDSAGKRLIMSERKFGEQDILDELNADFPELKGKIAVGEPGTGDYVTDFGYHVDNTKTKEFLGFKFRPFDETVRDAVRQLLDAEKQK